MAFRKYRAVTNTIESTNTVKNYQVFSLKGKYCYWIYKAIAQCFFSEFAIIETALHSGIVNHGLSTFISSTPKSYALLR